MTNLYDYDTLVKHCEFPLPDLGSMAACDATMKMWMLMPMPSPSYAALDTHTKYMWVVIRTQKERKLQTLIEVYTDFASLGQTTTAHRPAEQVFALEEDDDPEDMVAMIDHSQWTGPNTTEPNMPPSLQQMFTLARRMGYEMRPMARRTGATRQAPSSPRMTG